MDHLAIMKKSWNLTDKILSGQKIIESRWYKNKYTPWDKIKIGEVIYFKNSGEPVTIRSSVKNILQFSDLNHNKVNEILKKYGKDDGIEKENIKKFYDLFKDKKYCMLIFLKNPKKIKPFNINKKGFGTMSAWITVESINLIKV